MKTIFLPGRWQAPGGPHAGHRYLIEKAIEEGYRVIIGVRDIPKNDKDPHDVETRMAQFRKLYGKRVSFVTIPEDGDGLEVWYGRGVGWEIKEIEVPDSIRKISGTSLRKLEESTIWFTGIPCSGKTTLALKFKSILEDKGYKVLHLDGDKCRKGICSGLGFSDEGRKENLRRISHISELANQDKIIVLASYVSPTEEMRDVVRNIVENLRMVYVDCDSSLDSYVVKLESEGNEVHYPIRDVNQNIRGIEICKAHKEAMIECDEVHIAWNKSSSGSIWDAGMAWVLNKPIKLVDGFEINQSENKCLDNVFK
jgi:gluconate kinase